jgi:hypothetical protein
MLLPYAKCNDVSTDLSTKLNISDTANMLNSYARTNDVNDELLTKLNISDTAAMLSPYYPSSMATTALALKENISNKSSSTALGTSDNLYPTQHAVKQYVDSSLEASTDTAANKYVKLTTDQTISGKKTFSSDLRVNGLTIGKGTGQNDQNTAIGSSALGSGTGSRNTAVGFAAMQHYNGISFDNNTSVGYSNMAALTSGSANTSIGAEAMLTLTTGTNNTAIGQQTLINATGNENTAVGSAAGQAITSGSQNTFIGRSANASANNLNNATAIGYSATVDASNKIQLGNTSVTSVNTSGKLTTGTVTYPNADGSSGQVLTTNGSGTVSFSYPITDATDEFTATASQTSFTLTHTPSARSKVKMYINGIRISNTAYSVSGTTLTYTASNNGSYSLTVSDRIQFDYFY